MTLRCKPPRVGDIGKVAIDPSQASRRAQTGPLRGTESGPDVLLIGGTAVLIQGLAALDIYRLVVEGIATVQRRDCIAPNPRLRHTVAALKAAAAAAHANVSDTADTTDVRDDAPSARSDTPAPIGIQEVARMAGVGDRQARRLAPSLGGTKKRSGEWLFDRQHVQTYLNGGTQ